MPSRLLLDPWPPDYDSAVQFDEQESVHEAQVDITIETIDWRAIRYEGSESIPLICFVDGVRRVDARVISQESDEVVYGLFGSAGVGSVFRRDAIAQLESLSVKRYLILGRGNTASEQIRIGECTLNFEGISTAATNPLEVLAALQNLMRTEEAQLGQKLLSDDTCVFADGPLSYFSTATQALVGVIKRIHRLYLPADCLSLLAQLGQAERTPLFSIRDGKYDRYSCYLRLVQPQQVEHPLSGLVRLEVRSAIGLEKSLRLVNYASRELPKFVSSPIRDPRAPQNLVPVGALEEELRRRLGDPILVRRAVENRIYEGVQV